MRKIILFDGDCNFCNRSVHFIIKRDSVDHFRFAPLQSEIGQDLVKKYNIPQHIDSLLLIDEKKWYSKSSAALHICKHLKGFWKLFFLLMIIPKPIRDLFYRIIAKNRYRISGKQQECAIPTPEMRRKFL